MSYDFSNTGFSGVKNIGEHLLMSQIENNIKSFLDWGFLNIGGFINVTRPQNNIYGVNPTQLKPTEDPNFRTGQVWQTMRKDWVWEQDVYFTNCKYLSVEPSPSPSLCPTYVEDYDPCPSELIETIFPILITGIYINNTFYPIDTIGQYSYKVDYINSRIIFDNAVSTSLNIEMEYSYRWVQVYNYDNAKWWQQLQYVTDANAKHFDQINKGDFSILSNNRVQLPAIIIETISRGLSEPWQLGDKSLIVKQELMLHIVAENMADRNKIIDILRLQQDRFIKMYDTNLVIKNRVQPFNIDGTLNERRLQYDKLINCSSYNWLQCRMIDIYAADVESFSPFFSEANLRLTMELIFSIRN
jgi:hypothetical protein